MSRLLYGSGNNNISQLAADNFNTNGMMGMSFCTTPVEILANDGTERILASASGFFWRTDTDAFLVTNFHVISGKDFFTRQRGPEGLQPRIIRYYGTEISREGVTTRLTRFKVTMVMSDELMDAAETPPMSFGHECDLAVLRIELDTCIELGSFDGDRLATSFVNQQSLTNLETHATDECVILGYPLSNYEGFRPPLYRRGAVASDPLFGVAGMPIFLIDGRTESGMSGAPIFRRQKMLISDPSRPGVFFDETGYTFIGVYSGRLQHAVAGDVDIGYGWFGNLVDPIARITNQPITRHDRPFPGTD